MFPSDLRKKLLNFSWYLICFQEFRERENLSQYEQMDNPRSYLS